MKLPSREECLEMLKEHKNPEIIINHSLKVAELAKYLADSMKKNGVALNVDLVEKSALLHDVAKFASLDSDIRHGIKGKEIMLEKGYPEIAKIVEEHALSEILEKDRLKSWESRLVYYADKRVTKDKIVSLDERFSYLRKRYGTKSKKILGTINKCYGPCKKLEAEILSLAKLDPELSNLGG